MDRESRKGEEVERREEEDGEERSGRGRREGEGEEQGREGDRGREERGATGEKERKRHRFVYKLFMDYTTLHVFPYMQQLMFCEHYAHKKEK